MTARLVLDLPRVTSGDMLDCLNRPRIDGSLNLA